MHRHLAKAPSSLSLFPPPVLGQVPAGPKHGLGLWGAVSWQLVTPNHVTQSARGFRMQAPTAQGPHACLTGEELLLWPDLGLFSLPPSLNSWMQ
jgi:hypothetical protein